MSSPSEPEGFACSECGLALATVSPADAVVALRSFPRRYRLLFTGLEDESVEDPAAVVRRRPDPGTWSALEYAAHVRDMFELADDRLRRTLVEDRPSFSSVDVDRLAVERRYNNEDPSRTLDGLATRATALAETVSGVAATDWRRTMLVDGVERTALWTARNAVHEGSHHLRDVDRVLRAVVGRPSPSAPR